MHNSLFLFKLVSFFSSHMKIVLQKVRQAPHPFPSISHGLACGTDNRVSVAVCPWLLVLVNAISAVTHKAFVFHHAAVGAHPLCQPASLSPGIIYPRSTKHMGHFLLTTTSVLSTRAGLHAHRNSFQRFLMLLTCTCTLLCAYRGTCCFHLRSYKAALKISTVVYKYTCAKPLSVLC